MGQSLGLFITFEGIDGSGKSTQMVQLAEALPQILADFGQGHRKVISTRNPGGTPVGQDIRQLVLHSKAQSEDPTEVVSPMCELMLYMADRAHHMETLVAPALAQGHIVLCDRHIDSSVAYQGYGRQLPLETIHALNSMAILGHTPDLTLLFDANPEELAKRVVRRAGDQGVDRLEQEAMAFHHRVRQGYLELSQQNTHRFYVFNALQTVEVLHQQTLERVTAFLKSYFSSSTLNQKTEGPSPVNP